MSRADAIAIVGRGCILPGALNPAELWARIIRQDDLTGPSTEAKWGLAPSTVCADPIEPSACARGGYVEGFVSAREDDADAAPLGWQWLVAAARQALNEAGVKDGRRTGLILGSLGYPSREMADVAATRWRGDTAPDERALDGQSGALHWTIAQCGLGGPRLALDAACASGLYALKIACDRLRAGDADVMLAAGLNAADDLFLHIGFTALGALSPSGRSSPLSTLADGLLPAEGAAVVALKRLDAAIRDGDRILAIIRGVALSNDGRGSGLLTPTTSGQQRAMRAVYEASGVAPEDVAYLECHATGTAIGDREEILSVRAVYGDEHPLRLGSLKAQLGHLITASATAGLLKLCAMFEHATLPPAPRVGIDHPIATLEGAALTLAREAESWASDAGSRFAAINAFGFGGCNAHAVLEGPEGANASDDSTPRLTQARCAPRLALVACEVAVGTADDTDAALRVLLGVDAPTRRVDGVELAIAGLGFPPVDLQSALAAQLLLLRVAQTMRPQIRGADARLGVFIGSDVDPAAARHGYRRRLERMVGRKCSDRERNSIVPPLQAAGVLGTMPNMPANRLNNLLDARGPGFTVSDGAQSGTRALELAADALAAGEIDAAIVGAVDASGGAFGDDPTRADAAVLMLLVRAGDAPDRRSLATIVRDATDDDDAVALPWADAGTTTDLLHIAVAALCCRHGLLPSNQALPWITQKRTLRTRGWRISGGEPQGVAFEAPEIQRTSDRPASDRGDLAWTFTGAAATYPGAGLTLLRAFPQIATAIHQLAPRLAESLPALVGRETLSLVDQLQLGTLISQSHARLLTMLGVVPDATVGLSSGETNALLATGAWSDADALFADVTASGMYDTHLGGRYEALRHAWQLETVSDADWRCFRVVHPVAALRAAIERYPRVRLLIVHHDGDATIGGEASACEAIIAALGAQAAPIHHDLVVHCPELGPFADVWYRVHHRRTRAITAPRMYANAINRVFVPSDDRCAELLTAQACNTVVFDATIEQAYADGVRTFVELGPRGACSGWIREILHTRPHVACALDGATGSLSDLAAALTALAGAGHRVAVDGWNTHMRGLRVISRGGRRPRTAATLRFQGHLPQPRIDAPRPARLQLTPAPALAPVLPDRLRPIAIAAPASVESALEPTFTVPHVAALIALEDTQQALLRVQALTIEHLCAAPLPATATTTVVPPPAAITPVAYSRAQLEVHASGRISEIFGAMFEPQDGYRRQVRMPMPPLLLADRVTEISGEPGSMGTGVVWTETDVRADAWYLHHGRMPAGILIESGQADLFLISWLGIDLHNRGNRVYRLLGCELTFHAQLPAVGETLRYEIAVDGHARHGEIGLFFFHYDCRSGDTLRLSVRHGQAGFFTDEELATSAGVLWNPADDVPDATAPLATARPGVRPANSYDERAVAAFATGDLARAFGDGFARAASHTRSPRIPGDRMRLFDRVDELDLHGGPWGRGYLRATLPITPDAWFFNGHFHNDPCMPGTLMFEGALQTMVFYLSALGYSIDRDGWRFEPEPEIAYTLRCRGQVTPGSKELVYEMFVAELHDGAEPVLVADLLGTVDGLRAFHCRRMRLKLVPDNPLDAHALAQIAPDEEPVAEYDGFRYGHASLLACANGEPTAAFGPLYASLPPSRRVPRLPAPPYHFITRVSAISEPPGQMRAGVVADTAYDIPPDAWYFAAHPGRQMPTCVLVEAALQPCGWLASYVGCAVDEQDEVFFRNLDGSGVLHRTIRPDDGTLHVKSRLTTLSSAGGITLVSFDVVCTIGSETIYELKTTFGFFPKAALEGQAGLAVTAEQRALADAPGVSDLLATLDPRAALHLPAEQLRMCERVTYRHAQPDGRTSLRGEKDVRADEWFFRSHFFQDPVQPGSLGVEALVQLLQAHLLLEGAAEAVANGAFVDLAGPDATVWQFRGQVLPDASLVTLTLEAEPIRKEDDRWIGRAAGSVWVDGLRIYHVRGITVTFAAVTPSRARELTVTLDPATQPHWLDHRPTFGPPVLPGLAFISLIMDAAPHAKGVDDLALRRWLVLDRPRTLTVRVEGDAVTVIESGSVIADGRLSFAVAPAPDAIVPLSDAAQMPSPYDSGELFHGPAYQIVADGHRDHRGADLRLRVDGADDGHRVSHFLLDAGLHGVPHDSLEQWFPDLEPGLIGYPSRIERFRLCGEIPRTGGCEVRVRPVTGETDAQRQPRLLLQFLVDGLVWAELVLVEARLPATRLGRLPGRERLAFLRDGQFVAGARLSDERDAVTTLESSSVALADWLPGTIDAIYGLGPADALPSLQAIAAREHTATRLGVHPRALRVAADGTVTTPQLPLLDYRVAVEGDSRRVTVADARGPNLALDAVTEWWRREDWRSESPDLHALFLEMARQFVAAVRLLDADAIDAVRGTPLLLLANHQVAVESVLASVVLPPIIGRPLTTIAKDEHRDTWVGRLAIGLDDARRGPSVVYVDRDRAAEMLERLGQMRDAVRSHRRSLMVHVEGTRAIRGGQPVATVSAVWSDLAAESGLTVVPIRFCGGLPFDGVDTRLEFAHGLGGQEIVLGRPIAGEELASLPLNARRDRVLGSLAELEAYDFAPRGNHLFAARVARAQARWQLDELRAVFLLIQAAARGWTLDAQDLPAADMARRDPHDPFWNWFDRSTEKEHAR